MPLQEKLVTGAPTEPRSGRILLLFPPFCSLLHYNFPHYVLDGTCTEIYDMSSAYLPACVCLSLSRKNTMKMSSALLSNFHNPEYTRIISLKL